MQPINLIRQSDVNLENGLDSPRKRVARCEDDDINLQSLATAAVSNLAASYLDCEDTLPSLAARLPYTETAKEFGLSEAEYMAVSDYIESVYGRFIQHLLENGKTHLRIKTNEICEQAKVRRTIVFYQNRDVLVQDKARKYFARGTSKTVKCSYDYRSDEIRAEANSVAEKESHKLRMYNEINNMRMLSEARRTVKLISVIYYETKGNKLKQKMVMPLYEHGDLRDYLDNIEFPLMPRDKVGVMWSLARALSDVHKQEMIHKDVKERNFFVDHKGHVYIGDFGYAGKVHSEMWPKGGTPGYFAPEIFDDHCPLDQSRDIWSLGVVFYKLYMSEGPKWLMLRSKVDMPGEAFARLYRDETNAIYQNRALFNESYPEPDKSCPIKHLIWSMLRPEPTSRPSIADIQKVLRDTYQSS